MFGRRRKPEARPMATAEQIAAIEERVLHLQEARIQRLAEERALSMLRGRITLEMIRADGGEHQYEYRGVPVTRQQMFLLDPDFERHAHHFALKD